MKVLICDPVDAAAVAGIREAGFDVDVRDSITFEELMDEIGSYHAVVVRSRTKIRESLIDKADKLKVIVRGGVGLDNIDVAYAESKGISVLNTPAASSASVAELAIGYLFALARRIPQASASMKAGLWEKKKFKGTELGGKTLGVIGFGRIGQETAKRASALGMNVIAYDPYASVNDIHVLVPLDELLAKSDYITLHVPHTESTHHIIDADAIGKMKDGIRIVNCARGGVVDEEALYEAVKSGKVAGAALDVFAEEPPTYSRLFELDQIIGSPHVGASTAEGQARVGEEIVERLIDFFKEN
ncbi:MAG: hypothetical protein JXA25_17290 [Anaerolineales bacterium]|nr:hypothetical protein [Anaerolineales bacterium]